MSFIRFSRFTAVLGLLGLAALASPATAMTAEAPTEGPTTMSQPTDVRALFTQMTGTWSGIYSLWLEPGQEAHISNTTAKVESETPGAYAVMTYTWAWKETPQSGVLLLGGKEGKAVASWGDSWHQSPAPLESRGELLEDGSYSVRGTYPAGEGPDWGWRTDLILKDSDHLSMVMYNITPEGEEMLAVRADYERTD